MARTNPKRTQALIAMGRWLRKVRLQRNHTIVDVAAAIGKDFRYVSEVELGKRGHQMDPLIALLWSEYLALDPETFFNHLGLGETDLDRFRVQQYLQTSAWAHRFTQGKRQLDRALPVAESLYAKMRHNSPEKSEAKQILDAIRGAVEALRIPRNPTKGQS